MHVHVPSPGPAWLFGVMIDNHEHEKPTKRRVSGLPKEET